MTTETTITTADILAYYLALTATDSAVKWEQGLANFALQEVVKPMLCFKDTKGRVKMTPLGNIAQAYGKAGLNPLQAIKAAKVGLNDADTKNVILSDEEIGCIKLCLLSNRQASVPLSSKDEKVKQFISVSAMLTGLTSGVMPKLTKGDALDSFFHAKF
jgi:hypothetical protein